MEKENLNPLIMLDDVYGISVDSIDYSLRKNIKSDKTGKTRQDTVGYYSSLSSCLKAYTIATVHDCLESDKSMTLKEAADRISKEMGRVFSIIEHAFPEYEIIKG